MKTCFLSITIAMSLFSCHDQRSGVFTHDLSFLKSHDSSLVVLQDGDAKIIVSPKYQAKVFTSTADGSQSFGWIHYKAFDSSLDPHMNAYGGENRFWLGPEGGKFSLFFPKATKMEFAHWKTPAAFDSEPWTLVVASKMFASLRKDMQLTNYAGSTFSLRVDRKITLLSRPAMGLLLQTDFFKDLAVVAYRTENTVTNTGNTAWDDSTGMPCTWILDMFPPSEHTTIVMPYKLGQTGSPATTDYFGEILPDRIKYGNDVLYFKGDGKQRGKLGMHPAVAKNVAGSYDATKKVLTIILFDVDPLGKYLNQEWRIDKATFSGDAMNAYNDGPLVDGTQMGPFYELESVSTAHYLAPGQSATHWHSVFHITGDEAALSHLSEQVLGVSLEQIKKAL